MCTTRTSEAVLKVELSAQVRAAGSNPSHCTVGAVGTSISLGHFAPYNGSSLVQDRVQTSTAKGCGQHPRTDLTGNGIRVPPEGAKRHRMRGFRIRRICSSCVFAPSVVLKRLSAAAHFLRAFAITGVRWHGLHGYSGVSVAHKPVHAHALVRVLVRNRMHVRVLSRSARYRSSSRLPGHGCSTCG